MGKFNSNKVIRGTFGRAWVDGDLMANVKSFEAKATIDYEDLDINGDFGQKKRYMGYSIAGTMTLHKFDSYILKKYQAAIMSGDLPEMKIVASLADPQSDGTQRVALYDVHLDEIPYCSLRTRLSWRKRSPLPRGPLNSWT